MFSFRDVGRQATQLILEEAHRVGEGLEPGARSRIYALTSAIQRDLGILKYFTYIYL